MRLHDWNHHVITKAITDGQFDALKESSKLTPSKPVEDPAALCPICFTEPGNIGPGCGHGACKDCWTRWVQSGLEESHGMKCVKCIAEGCGRILSPSFIEGLSDPHLTSLARKGLAEHYIKCSHKLVWCPSPACSSLVYSTSGVDAQNVRCPREGCSHEFCFSCLKSHGAVLHEPHQPAMCAQMHNWGERVAKLDENKEDRWKLFRAKKCPGCDAMTIKCGCIDKGLKTPECEEMDYCPNKACNHMTCAVCNKHYCWVCLKPWEQHSSFFECDEAQTGDGAVAARFKYCYQRYLTHQSAYESAHKMIDEWMEIARKEDVPKPEGHYLYKCIMTIIKFEKTLKHSYILLFYLSNDHFAGYRSRQSEIEGFVAELSHEIEETDMLACARMSIADQTQKSVQRFVKIGALEEKLEKLRRADLSGCYIPVDEVDDPKHAVRFKVQEADPVALEGAMTCPYCDRPGFATAEDMTAHVLAHHIQDTRSQACPVCQRSSAPHPLAVHFMEGLCPGGRPT